MRLTQEKKVSVKKIKNIDMLKKSEITRLIIYHISRSSTDCFERISDRNNSYYYNYHHQNYYSHNNVNDFHSVHTISLSWH